MPATLLRELKTSAAVLCRNLTALRRSEALRARADTRTWMLDRRARTRRLIELGGLVAKSGLEEIVAPLEPDARAVILGALMHLADALREPMPGAPSPLTQVTVWRERGRAALRTESIGKVAAAEASA